MEHFSEAVRGDFDVVRDVPGNHQNDQNDREKINSKYLAMKAHRRWSFDLLGLL